MHVCSASDPLVVGAAKETAEFHDALNNKLPTNMVAEFSRCTGCAFDRNFKDEAIKMCQTAFVEKYLKAFENRRPNKPSVILANTFIELGPRTEDDPGGPGGKCPRRGGRKLFVACQHDGAVHRECCPSHGTP